MQLGTAYNQAAFTDMTAAQIMMASSCFPERLDSYLFRSLLHLLQAPSFYDEAPPAPPGILWWRYKPSVPPAVYQQTAAQTLGPSFAEYGWRYDPDFQTQSYTFSQLDHCKAPDLLGVQNVRLSLSLYS